ncbi:MAG: cation transporter [Bacteroidota bacterium]
MKTIKLIFAFCFLSFALIAGEVTIKSSIVCDMCKATIEEGLAFEKGIKRVLVDVKANTIFVKFNEEKISEEEIKEKISQLGYVADDIKPVKEAYDQLHGCCKMPGVCEDE